MPPTQPVMQTSEPAPPSHTPGALAAAMQAGPPKPSDAPTGAELLAQLNTPEAHTGTGFNLGKGDPSIVLPTNANTEEFPDRTAEINGETLPIGTTAAEPTVPTPVETPILNTPDMPAPTGAAPNVVEVPFAANPDMPAPTGAAPTMPPFSPTAQVVGPAPEARTDGLRNVLGPDQKIIVASGGPDLLPVTEEGAVRSEHMTIAELRVNAATEATRLLAKPFGELTPNEKADLNTWLAVVKMQLDAA